MQWIKAAKHAQEPDQAVTVARALRQSTPDENDFTAMTRQVQELAQYEDWNRGLQAVYKLLVKPEPALET